MKSGKYGLQIRAPASADAAKKPFQPPQKPSVFSQDDDDEDNVEQAIARQAAKKRSLKEVELQHKAALEQDATVFSYDEVYDEIKSTSIASKRVEKEQGKPKYITKLLDKAKTRQQEQEIIYERKLLRERQHEDHLYGDKDKFVTSAYKLKLAEQAKWLEEERMRELREQAEEVTNKSDLSDFYHHLFSKNVAFGAKKDPQQEAHPDIEQESVGAGLNVVSSSEPAELEKETTSIDDKKQGLGERLNQENFSIDGDQPEGSNTDGEFRPGAGVDHAEKQNASGEEEGKEGVSAKDSLSQPIDRRPSEDALASAKERYLARKRMRPT